MSTRRRSRTGNVEAVLVFLMTSAILGVALFLVSGVYFHHAGVPMGVHHLGFDLGGMSQSEAESAIEKSSISVHSAPIFIRSGDKVARLEFRKDFRFEVPAERIARQAISIGQEQWSWRDHVRHRLYLDAPRVDLAPRVLLDRVHGRRTLGRRLAPLLVEKSFARRLEGDRIEIAHRGPGTTLQEVLDRIEALLNRETREKRREVALDAGSVGARSRIVSIADPDNGLAIPLARRCLQIRSLDPAGYELLLHSTGRLDGTILNPGEVLSFHRGLAGLLIPDSSGSRPLSILATTLHAAALAAGAEVLERSAHREFTAEVAAFASPGLDVHVTPRQDLRMRSLHPAPILIRARLALGRLALILTSSRPLFQSTEVVAGRPTPIKLGRGPGFEVGLLRIWRVPPRGRILRVERLSMDRYLLPSGPTQSITGDRDPVFGSLAAIRG